jgi:hypothetical protein
MAPVSDSHRTIKGVIDVRFFFSLTDPTKVDTPPLLPSFLPSFLSLTPLLL